MLGIDKIVEHPYLVWDPDYPGIKSEIQPDLKLVEIGEETNRFVSIIDTIYDQEKTKEEAFMQALCSETSPLPEAIKNTLSSLWKNNKSQFMTFYDAYEKKLIKDTASVKDALAAIKKYYEKFRWANDKELIYAFFDQYALNLESTADEVFLDFQKYVANNQTYNQAEIMVIQKAIDIAKDEYYATDNKMAEELKNGVKFKDLTIIKTGKTSTGSIKDALLNKLGGIFPGKTAEVARGAAVTGSQKIEGKNIETDSAMFFTAELKRDFVSETDVALQRSYENMVKIEETIIKNKGYVIHDSIKSGGGNLKIKGLGSYKDRFEEIKNMLQKIGASFDSYKNFLFTFANTAQGFIAEGKWNAVQTALSQLAVIWMFDDMIPDLIQNIPATKALNFYNIRGYTISSSELLLLLKDKANNELRNNKKIKALVSFTRASKAELTKDEKQSILKQSQQNEIAAWNLTYETAMKRNQMGLNMNSNNFIKYLIES